MKTILDLLDNLYNKQRDLFILLFQRHHVLPSEIFEESIVDSLLKFHLVTKDKKCLGIKALVKINYTHGIFLFTDFIDEIDSRVFPFIDEGEIQYTFFKNNKHLFSDREHIRIWDMCTGSGHPLILMEQEFKQICNSVKAIGTDINSKAIKYCKNNILLNNSNAEILLSDFDSDLEASVKFDYIWSNPPFGLSPKQDSLHTYGGKYGLDKTIRSFEAIKTRLASKGIAQVLCYSIGNMNSLLVESYIQRILPSFKYEISFLNNQKIWRFHGVKSCSNPMPIDYISVRATDKYYNLMNIPKESWLELAKEIKDLGYTHLHMVLITIYKD